MRRLGPSAARCEATARPAALSGLAAAAALLGYVGGLQRFDAQADAFETHEGTDGSSSTTGAGSRWTTSTPKGCRSA
jgi:hypothetical protein